MCYRESEERMGIVWEIFVFTIIFHNKKALEMGCGYSGNQLQPFREQEPDYCGDCGPPLLIPSFIYKTKRERIEFSECASRKYAI
jgi:hypothetical protein